MALRPGGGALRRGAADFRDRRDGRAGPGLGRAVAAEPAGRLAAAAGGGGGDHGRAGRAGQQGSRRRCPCGPPPPSSRCARPSGTGAWTTGRRRWWRRRWSPPPARRCRGRCGRGWCASGPTWRMVVVGGARALRDGVARTSRWTRPSLAVAPGAPGRFAGGVRLRALPAGGRRSPAAWRSPPSASARAGRARTSPAVPDKVDVAADRRAYAAGRGGAAARQPRPSPGGRASRC